MQCFSLFGSFLNFFLYLPKHFGVGIKGWEKRADVGNVTGAGHEWWYHWKADELKRANPSGLVPTLIPIHPESGLPDESKVGTQTGIKRF